MTHGITFGESIPTIEEQLLPRLINLFDIDVDIVFYALTSSYVEGRAEWSDLLRRGYARDMRTVSVPNLRVSKRRSTAFFEDGLFYAARW